MCPIVELSHVYTRIGASVVHEDINLQVTRGEIFALVGGSGAGKSVLLREIIMLQAPTSGSIRVLGQEVVGIDERGALELRRRFGVLLQRPALFDGLTVAENVAIPFREHTSLNRTLITKLAALKLAIAGFPAEGMHRYPSELSPSMRKRAALARAIALDPELLFLDEPSTGLDPYSARELDDLIQQLKESLRLTVFIVTHDLDSLWRATDRVAVLGDRSIRGVGTMEELTQSEDPLIRVYFYGPRGQSAWQRARDRGASA